MWQPTGLLWIEPHRSSPSLRRAAIGAKVSSDTGLAKVGNPPNKRPCDASSVAIARSVGLRFP
jgi:hypothetical protein